MMELTTGQIRGQQIIDIEKLKQELSISTTFKIFVDTIDENNDVFVDGEILVVHIACSEYNANPDKPQLVRRRVEEALQTFNPEPSV